MPGIWDEILFESERENQKKTEHCSITIGSICPICGKADLEYNGLLSLVCPQCGQEYCGSFT